MADEPNDVQLGRILERIDDVRKDVSEIKESMARKSDVDALHGQFTMLKEDHEARLRIVEKQATRADERQKLLSGLLAGISLLASGVAAFLGIRS